MNFRTNEWFPKFTFWCFYVKFHPFSLVGFFHLADEKMADLRAPHLHRPCWFYLCRVVTHAATSRVGGWRFKWCVHLLLPPTPSRSYHFRIDTFGSEVFNVILFIQLPWEGTSSFGPFKDVNFIHVTKTIHFDRISRMVDHLTLSSFAGVLKWCSLYIALVELRCCHIVSP